MNISFAALCEAATVRDGFVNVLGAGINEVALSQVPGPIELTVALLVTLTEAEVLLDHSVAAVLRHDAVDVAVVTASWKADQLPEASLSDADVPIPFPFVLPSAAALMVPADGLYDVVVQLDGEDAWGTKLRVRRRPTV